MEGISRTYKIYMLQGPEASTVGIYRMIECLNKDITPTIYPSFSLHGLDINYERRFVFKISNGSKACAHMVTWMRTMKIYK